MGVDEKDDWYYLGCEECNRKVETSLVIEEAEDGAEEAKFKQVLICSNPDCPKEVVSATPIKENVGAIQLLAKSKQGQESSEEKTTPYQFKALNDKKYVFKIQVGQFNIDNHTDGYAIHKVVNDQSIIESLEKQITTNQHGVDEPVGDVSLSDLSTQNVFALKEPVDSIGDSFTPECTSKDCLKTSSIELKRNLSEV